MKLFKTLLVMLCVCIVSLAKSQSQDIETVISQTNMANWYSTAVNPGNQAVDSFAQTFYWPGGEMVDLNFLPMDPMSIPDRAGNIILTYGDPYGEVAFEKDTLFAGLGRFISDEEAQEVTSSSEASFTWLHSVCQFINYDSVGWQFRDVKMTFPVNEYFPPGQMSLVVSVDPTDTNTFSGGARRVPWLITYGNCPSDMSCTPEYVVVNPYEDGDYFVGGGTGEDGTHYPLAPFWGGGYHDIAFEVTRAMDHTGVQDVKAPPKIDWNGKIEIYDLAGRLVAKDVEYLANAQGIHIVRSGQAFWKVMAPFRP